MLTSNRARRWKRIARLYNSGRTRREIGDRLDLDPARVGAEIAKMRAAGWDLPHRPAASAPELARREKTVLRMWPSGASRQEIADELGMTLAGAAALIARLRARGADLPRRRAPAQRDAPKRDRVLELWADGLTLAQIAAETGATAASVATTITWARKIGLDVELRSDPAALAANRERIAALYRDGQPLVKIAAETGVSVAAASMTLARLREDGLDLPWRSQRRADAPSTARPGPPPGAEHSAR